MKTSHTHQASFWYLKSSKFSIITRISFIGYFSLIRSLECNYYGNQVAAHGFTTRSSMFITSKVIPFPHFWRNYPQNVFVVTLACQCIIVNKYSLFPSVDLATNLCCSFWPKRNTHQMQHMGEKCPLISVNDVLVTRLASSI